MIYFKNIFLTALACSVLVIGALPILSHYGWLSLPDFIMDFNYEAFSFWPKIYLLLYAFFAAVSFEVIGNYANDRYKDFGDGKMETYLTNKKVSRWLSLAMFLWAFSALIKLISAIKGVPIPHLASSIISSLNSMFLLWGLLYLEMDFSSKNKKFLFQRVWESIGKQTEKYRMLLGLFTAIIIFLEITFTNMGSDKLVFFPDMLLTLLVCFVIGTGMYNVFLMRQLKDLGAVSLLAALTILVSQITNLYDVFLESNLNAPVQMILSITYTSFLVTLLFALELSWLGWKKGKIIEEKNNQINEKMLSISAAKNNEKRQKLKILEANRKIEAEKKALELETEINRGFIILVSQNLKGRSLKDTLYYCLDLLKDKNLHDYAFAVGIFNLSKGLIEFPYYFERGVEKGDKTISINNTFGGFALTQNKEVVVYDLYDVQERTKFGIDELGYITAPEAKSLLYMPLIKDHPNAVPFGVMTIQSESNRVYSDEDLALIRAIAYLLGQVINPESTK